VELFIGVIFLLIFNTQMCLKSAQACIGKCENTVFVILVFDTMPSVLMIRYFCRIVCTTVTELNWC